MQKKNFIYVFIFAVMWTGIGCSQDSKKSVENAAIGSEVNFGTWYFEKDGTEKPIVWVVADKNMQDRTVLLVSKYIIENENMQYSNDVQLSNWNNSQVREWLNGDFYNKAFTQEEKAHIKHEFISGGNNPKYDKVNSSIFSEDYVFILSIDEQKKFLKKRAKPTPYIKPKIKTYLGYSCYWLRTLGIDHNNVSSVNPTGRINYEGYFPINHGGVRPALVYSLDINGQSHINAVKPGILNSGSIIMPEQRDKSTEKNENNDNSVSVEDSNKENSKEMQVQTNISEETENKTNEEIRQENKKKPNSAVEGIKQAEQPMNPLSMQNASVQTNSEFVWSFKTVCRLLLFLLGMLFGIAGLFNIQDGGIRGIIFCALIIIFLKSCG